MRISNDRIVLRDFEKNDIQKRIYWETVETEWQLWDAPWEYENLSYEQKIKELDEYIITMNGWVNKFSSLSEDIKRTGFQISINDSNYTYIGWCNSYDIDEECNYSKTGKRCAVGIDIPDKDGRGKGLGFNSLSLFINYLLSNGETDIYTQTWSGNVPMIRLANKLGFEECNIKKNIRTVRGEKYDAVTFRLNIDKFKALKNS